MKKIYLSILVVASLHGEVLTSTELSLNVWKTTSDNTFQAQGDKVDLGEMGDVEGIAPALSVDMKTAHEKMPNIKLQYTKIDADDKTTLSNDLQYNDANLAKNDKVKTTYTADIFDAILYSNVVKEKKNFNVDIGGGLRYIDSSLEVGECAKKSKSSFKQYVPLLYTKATYDFGESDVLAKGELIYSPIDDQHIDLKLAVGYNINKEVNVELGYRLNQIDSNADKIKSDVTTTGAYLGLAYTF